MRIEEIRRVTVAVTLAAVVSWWLSTSRDAELFWLPISQLTARGAEAALDRLGTPVVREWTLLRHVDGFSCEVGLVCTFLIPSLLMSAGVLAKQTSWRRRTIGVLAGTAMLAVLNQIRLTTLVWIGVHNYSRFDLMHTVVWPMVLVFVGVAYWLAWAKHSTRSSI